jgi:hypothetical protein
MSPLQALKKFFTSSVPGHAPMDDVFVQIDRENWIKDLKLVERGKEQGELNLPRADDDSLDVVESDIVSRIGDELNAAQIYVRNQTQAYESRLANLQLLHELGSIRGATKKATGDFETLVIDWRNRLSNRRDAIRESYHDLKLFKTQNGLTRPAFEVPSKVVTFGSIALAGLAEIFGNAIFLRVNDDLGLLGGVLAAIMVAAVNIVVAVVVGYFVWPRAHLRNTSARTTAFVGIGLWVLFLGVWNFLAAHYRDAKSLGMDDPQGAAARLLVEQPFHLQGIYSWGILIIGIIAAVISARSAYRMDDPFPGYGERARQHRGRCEEYADEVAEANRQITGVRDDAISDAEEVKRQLEIQLRERDRIAAAYDRLISRFDEHQDRLEETANVLLSTYRNANRQARSLPEPKHFGQKFALQRSTVTPLHRPEVREADVRSAQSALTKCVDEVDEAFRQTIGRFEPLDKLRAELERGAV